MEGSHALQVISVGDTIVSIDGIHFKSWEEVEQEGNIDWTEKYPFGWPSEWKMKG